MGWLKRVLKAVVKWSARAETELGEWNETLAEAQEAAAAFGDLCDKLVKVADDPKMTDAAKVTSLRNSAVTFLNQYRELLDSARKAVD